MYTIVYMPREKYINYSNDNIFLPAAVQRLQSFALPPLPSSILKQIKKVLSLHFA